MSVHPLRNVEQAVAVKPRSAMSRWASPRHKAVARDLGYVLMLGDARAWTGFTIVAGTRLTLAERAALAVSVLRTFDPFDIRLIVEAVNGEVDHGIGPPIPAFDSVMAEASFWADMADPVELDAYALACFNRMAPERQAAFLEFIQERAVS